MSPTWSEPERAVSGTSGLVPLDEVGVALQVISQIGQTIQSADTKSGMLGALLGLLLAAVAGNPGSVHATMHGAVRPPHVAIALLVAFVVSLIIAATFVGLTQMPRLAGSRPVSWLAFPTVPPVAAGPAGRPNEVELRDDAWHEVQILAAIARVKFRYLRLALATSGACAFTGLAWLALAANGLA